MRYFLVRSFVMTICLALTLLILPGVNLTFIEPGGIDVALNQAICQDVIWSPAVAYPANARVAYNESIWQAQVANTDTAPAADSDVWQEVAPCPAPIAESADIISADGSNAVDEELAADISVGADDNPAFNFRTIRRIFDVGAVIATGLALYIMGLVLWGVRSLVWPLFLFLSGRVVLWTFGLFLIVINAIVFAIFSLIGGGTFGENPLITVNDPKWVHLTLASIVITFLMLLLESITGIDSPIKGASQESQAYWKTLGKISFVQRNVLIENLRVAQLIDLITRYTRDIVTDRSPFGRIRQSFQRFIYTRKEPVIDESTPETARLMLQQMGPTFVKLGQIVSSRAENLPPEWRESLTKLQSSVEPFSSIEAAALVEAELGAPPDAIYAEFSPTPFAAASTAQVHRATLQDGQEVVVKVQRPNIDVTVRADLNVLRDLTRLMDRRFDWAAQSDLNGIMNEYADSILRELDYTNEAFNGQLLAQNMAVFPDVHIPAIYTDLSTRRVMTQEFVKGVKITKIDELDAAGIDRTELAKVFMRALMKQVIFDGFFHGDPHPGNVMVNTENGKLIFLDMGMMGELSSNQRLALADLIWSISLKDGYEVGKVALKLTTAYRPVDEKRFLEEVDRTFNRYTSISGANMSMNGAMRVMLDALSDAGLRLDPDMTIALKALVQAEEIVSTLDPTLPLIEVAVAESRELLRRTFDPDALTEALKRQAIRSSKELVRQIPNLEAAAAGWLQQFMRGRLTLYIDASDVGEQLNTIDRSISANVRRLTAALLLAGLVIGTGIAVSAGASTNTTLHTIAYAIFLFSSLMAVGIVLRMLWHWLDTGEF